MAHDVAKTIMDLAHALEKHETIIIEVTHGFMDEYSVSKCIRMKPDKDTCVIYYKNTTVHLTAQTDWSIIDIILQQILIEFLEIVEKQDGYTCFTIDMDFIEIRIHADHQIIASGTYYFSDTVFCDDINSFVQWFDPTRHMTLKNMFKFYMRFASIVKKNNISVI
jgi:hypothetical protein